MTERERLIELLCSAPLGSKTFEQQYYKSTITKIADYLLENGVSVPCKMGDTVYKVVPKCTARKEGAEKALRKEDEGK